MGALAAALTTGASAGERTIRRMMGAVPHRGTGTTLVRRGRWTLGVVGADRDASVTAGSDLAAVVVGVLDDRPVLRRELERAGYPPAGDSPAELCLAAFRAFGPRAPDRLRGAFAAVVTDGARAWCFRDHIGFEPLFYGSAGEDHLVGSEAKQVTAGSDAATGPDLDLLERYFYGEDFDDGACALRGVRRVLGGHVLELAPGRVRTWRYWEPERLLETAGRLSREEVAEGFLEAMDRAARRAVTGDDAIALSGGIDSPAVAAFAAPAHLEASGRPLTAISAVYPDFPRCDETPYITEVADRLGLPLLTYEPDAQRLDRLQDWVRAFDGPWSIWSADGAANRYRQARDKGFDTLLTGELAEQVLETRRYHLPHLLRRGRLTAAWRHVQREHRRGTPPRRQARLALAGLAPRWVEARYRRSHCPWVIPPWLERDRIARRDAAGALPAGERWRAHQLAAFRGVGLSGEANALCQARFGVRVRVPWADVDLWSFFLSLPAEIKHADPRTKGLVRDLLRGRVPDRILDRRDKTVMNEWFESRCVDYPGLHRWLARPRERLTGVDYGLLGERIEAGDMELPEYLWARDLATVHAFLALW